MSSNHHMVAQSLMSENALVEEFRCNGALITLRRFSGPLATELHFTCKPTGEVSEANIQAFHMYSAISEMLKSLGASLESIVAETVFVRDMTRDIESIRQAIRDVVQSNGNRAFEPARTEIQQPPLDQNANLEIAVQAMIPTSTTIHKQIVNASSNSISSEGGQSSALKIQMEDEARLLAGGLCGEGNNAYEQTWGMFELAEKLLHEAGMEFNDVVRTWIYLREMERDYYPGLNKARREFFDSRGIDPVPASTGIEGGMVNAEHDICMGFYAIKSGKPLTRAVMTTPTLNEAGEYGADFTRGMKTNEANRVALHVSGTASIDEQGKTAHVDDIDSQIDRMILNIKELLAKQGAEFKDIAYAYNYLKDPADEQLLRDKFKRAGLEGFPSVFVHAQVCRPDLLCETEVLAILPK